VWHVLCASRIRLKSRSLTDFVPHLCISGLMHSVDLLKLGQAEVDSVCQNAYALRDIAPSLVRRMESKCCTDMP
jgi:hypothetical protein